MRQLRCLVVALFCLFVLSCGDGGGSGSSSSSSSSSGDGDDEGTTDTGTIVSVSVTPETYDVDYCAEITTTATAVLNATSVNADLPSNILSTESYSVTFTPADSGAPQIEGGTFADSRTLPASGVAVAFMSPAAKQALRQGVAQTGASSAYYSYIASYRFTGEDLYGSTWHATGEFSFSVGGYSTCPVTVYPPSATVTGLNNPDADASDDLTFSISFGTGPYTVYSDNSAIASPGALGADASSFTVDPDAVTSETTVTLTVTDALGAMAAVPVTISAQTFSVMPSGAAVIGLSNPDGDAADDLLFAITGGTEPYAVYSDNSAISSPGALGTDVSSFTVDPDEVFSETTVTLTVTDALGAVATARVTISAQPLSVTPSSATVIGLNNPDGDVADDLLFAITGGAGPYIVYSDNSAVTAPGGLGEGVASFTVDPVGAESDTVVTLTVADSIGATATAQVTITPP